MPVTLHRYALDTTGQSPDNLVANEPHTLGTQQVRIIAPIYGPYYKSSLVVKHTATGQTLVANIDYRSIEMLQDATITFGQEISQMIMILNQSLTGEVTLTYQVLGGYYQNSAKNIADMYQSVLQDARPVDFNNIVNLPIAFPPARHLNMLNDIIGFGPLVVATDRLAEAVTVGNYPVISDLSRWMQAETIRLDGRINTLNISASTDIQNIKDDIIELQNNSNITVNWTDVQNKPFISTEQTGQPTYIWGTNNGVQHYLWRPSNLQVKSASKLTTPVTINNVSFDGSSDITINAVDSTARIAVSDKGVANGVATLDASSQIPTTQIPSLSYIPSSDKGVSNGVATLGSDGKLTSTQMPVIQSKRNLVIFNANGRWYPPAGVTNVIITAVGGGCGAGWREGFNAQSSLQGQTGQTICKLYSDLTNVNYLDISVGAGGDGALRATSYAEALANNSLGSNGQDTTVTASTIQNTNGNVWITAKGGYLRGPNEQGLLPFIFKYKSTPPGLLPTIVTASNFSMLSFYRDTPAFADEYFRKATPYALITDTTHNAFNAEAQDLLAGASGGSNNYYCAGGVGGAVFIEW